MPLAAWRAVSPAAQTLHPGYCLPSAVAHCSVCVLITSCFLWLFSVYSLHGVHFFSFLFLRFFKRKFGTKTFPVTCLPFLKAQWLLLAKWSLSASPPRLPHPPSCPAVGPGAGTAAAADRAVVPVRQVLHEQSAVRGGPRGHA